MIHGFLGVLCALARDLLSVFIRSIRLSSPFFSVFFSLVRTGRAERQVAKRGDSHALATWRSSPMVRGARFSAQRTIGLGTARPVRVARSATRTFID